MDHGGSKQRRQPDPATPRSASRRSEGFSLQHGDAAPRQTDGEHNERASGRGPLAEDARWRTQPQQIPQRLPAEAGPRTRTRGTTETPLLQTQSSAVSVRTQLRAPTVAANTPCRTARLRRDGPCVVVRWSGVRPPRPCVWCPSSPLDSRVAASPLQVHVGQRPRKARCRWVHAVLVEGRTTKGNNTHSSATPLGTAPQRQPARPDRWDGWTQTDSVIRALEIDGLVAAC